MIKKMYDFIKIINNYIKLSDVQIPSLQLNCIKMNISL